MLSEVNTADKRMFAEDTYTKVESIDSQDIRVKIMDTCDNVHVSIWYLSS